MSANHEAEPTGNFINQLRDVRLKRGLTQQGLASKAGITRQAVSSIESNLYLPTTAVALRLASVLDCRVEDLFSLTESAQTIEGELLGSLPTNHREAHPLRVKVAAIGLRTIVRPTSGLGDILNYTVPADGYVVGLAGGGRTGNRVKVRLSCDRHSITREISVAGCDPAIYLAGEHLRRHNDDTMVVGWTMGSMAALAALQRGEVHVAGVHLFDPASGQSNLPFLRRLLKGSRYEVVTFAMWEEGFLVRPGNPKSLRTVADLTDPAVSLVNREEGSGARLLLDQRLRAAGIDASRVHGYDRTVASHFEVARAVIGRQADVGIGIRSAAELFGLDFVPLQSARYDLVVPKLYLESHPTLSHLFETLSMRSFRTEIEALGGYDTRETGTSHSLR
ncbi:MAG TPA: substrate-binding domain-containing protein [Nitrospira sp.]|nr:substrate-binding domain-containing protein [Nitrospira sp.]